jgi:hypothetical protein
MRNLPLQKEAVSPSSGKASEAIPIKADFSPVLPSELERSKTDYLKTIIAVRPAGDGN